MELAIKKIIPFGRPGMFVVRMTDVAAKNPTRYEVIITNTGGSATMEFSRPNAVRNAVRPFVNVRRDVKGAKLELVLTAAREAVKERT